MTFLCEFLQQNPLSYLPSFPLLRLSGWSESPGHDPRRKDTLQQLDRGYPLCGYNPAILTQGLLVDKKQSTASDADLPFLLKCIHNF